MARTTPILSDALDEYLATRVHLAKNTQINDTSILRGFVRYIGPLQVGHLTPGHVEAYFFGPDGAQARMNPLSYNKARQRVSLFLTFCAGRGWNKSPLMANVRSRKVIRRDRLRLSPSQLLRLLEATDNARDRCMLAVAMNLGLRASELTSLRVRDVNFALSTLHVVISKSGSEDHMPVTSDLAPALRRWLTQYQSDLERRGGLAPDAYLFPAREPSRLTWIRSGEPMVRKPGPWRPFTRMSHPARVVQEAIRTLGIAIEPGEGFHTIRRSVARSFFDAASAAGHDQAMRLTSAFLHHSSTVVTETYLGLKLEIVKRDDMLKDRPFLSAMILDENVVALRASQDE